MLNQLHLLGDRYEEWINSPVDREMIIFDNKFLEIFSKTPWYLILLIWIPVLTFIVVNEYTSEQMVIFNH